jgi:hypothetical protein
MTTVQVWRGESSGVLFDEFDLRQTNARVGFFFAESHAHAACYAGAGTEPRAFTLEVERVLDLRDVGRAWRHPESRAVIEALRAEFDEWQCRYSGEPRDVTDYLEAGDLYDYEGTGSGRRWNRLFGLAQEAGFDSVCVLDRTDGDYGNNAAVWVVFNPAQIQIRAPSPRPRFGPRP